MLNPHRMVVMQSGAISTGINVGDLGPHVRETTPDRSLTFTGPWSTIDMQTLPDPKFVPEPDRERASWSFAMLLAGLAGTIAFNVIIGVFGDVAARLGLAAFIATTLFVAWRSSRRREHDDA